MSGDTTVRSGTEIKAETEAPSVSINLRELDNGSWVIFELPGFTTSNAGTPQNSLDALRSANATSYYKGNGELWVKIVANVAPVAAGARGGRGGGTAVQVSK